MDAKPKQPQHFTVPARQRGVALIMALMITALVAALAVEMAWRFDLDLAKTSGRWQHIQAEKYLEGMEALAEYALWLDYDDDRDNNEIQDDLSEPWAEPLAAVPTDHGQITGKISDAQGKFNINLLAENIWRASNTNPADNYTEHQKRFIRLLQTINLSQEENPEEFPVYLDQFEATNIVEALIDWMDFNADFDDVTGNGGAEDSYYSQLTPPISIANKPMISITELRVIRGVTPILYQRLLPFVVALNPVSENGSHLDIGINVNTMPLELVRTLNSADQLEPLDVIEGERIFNELQNGFASINDFWASPVIDGVWPQQNNNADNNGSDNNSSNTGSNNNQQNNEFDPGDDREISSQNQGQTNTPTTTASQNQPNNRNFVEDGLVFSSQYFIVTALTEVGDEVFRGRSLVYRDASSGDVTVLRRSTEHF